MSESKHTPGDWRYGVRRDGSMWLSLGDPRTGPHYQGDLVASEPDARLIAAAPDMLEALQASATILRSFAAMTPVNGWARETIDAALRLADPAIAKAEGRS